MSQTSYKAVRSFVYGGTRQTDISFGHSKNTGMRSRLALIENFLSGLIFVFLQSSRRGTAWLLAVWEFRPNPTFTHYRVIFSFAGPGIQGM